MSADGLLAASNEIRENLINTAVKFLTNPNVQRCTMESKERFLRNKGLNDAEIQKAIEKVGEMIDFAPVSSEFVFYRHSRTSWFRDNVLPLIIYGGFAYGCYWFYKNCIRHMLFVEEPKRKSTEECIDELRKSLDVLNSNVTSLRGEIQTSVQQNVIRSQLDNIKSDISSVKGILLNRNQFSTLKARSDPPSIPNWQRQSAEATSTEAVVEEKKKPHRSRSHRSESGGSNSSEGEQATKNSDSSLEIIGNYKVPSTAYMLYIGSTRAQVEADNPGLKHTEICKKHAAIWRSMPAAEKNLWEEKLAILKRQKN
ncbi:peroxisomal membrane protein PEX14 isoform X2 [Achroia grisella]|uniref:peroxisomal membrane protein PEX14 isoform X2 n=1 Tax=Achroia grisella TaxID=688607 RepID=UPI0027D204AB|nr:peroxisomal membrane protein PEX14 isoform X2 [Achroia grisella]